MKPVRTETTNAVYTLEGCNDLPVTNMKMLITRKWVLKAVGNWMQKTWKTSRTMVEGFIFTFRVQLFHQCF